MYLYKGDNYNAIRAFVLDGFFVIQSFNIVLYTFDLVSNPVIGGFLIDAEKYPNLVLSDGTNLYRTVAADDAIQNFLDLLV